MKKKISVILSALILFITFLSCSSGECRSGRGDDSDVTYSLIAVDGPGKYVKREKPAGTTRDGDPILCYSVYVQLPNGTVRQYTIKTGGMYTLYLKFQPDATKATINTEGDYFRFGHQTFAPVTISIPSPDNIY